MRNLPKISAYCPTYRRPKLLEEAVQSFLMQDYAGEKELIILNDEPEQTLVFEHPQVKVYNMKVRSPDIASKYNYAMSLCTGDICLPWDDDDICLPHRLRVIAERQLNGCWYSDFMFTDPEDGKLTFTTGLAHNNHAFTKDIFIRAGAYHDREELVYDFRFNHLMRKLHPENAKLPPDRNMPSYIYRKNSTDGPNHSNHIGRDRENHYQNYSDALPIITRGTIRLSPKWTRDWMGMAAKEWNSRPEPKKLHEVDKAYPDPEYTPDPEGE